MAIIRVDDPTAKEQNISSSLLNGTVDLLNGLIKRFAGKDLRAVLSLQNVQYIKAIDIGFGNKIAKTLFKVARLLEKDDFKN